MDAAPHCPEAFAPIDPPVRLRLRGPARTTQVLILVFGLAAGFLVGTGFTLFALGAHP